MACTATTTATEFDFINATRSRLDCRAEQGLPCVGPLVTIALAGVQLERFEESFQSLEAHELLWDGYLPDPYSDKVAFSLCVAHWTDLVLVAVIRARQYSRIDWFGQSTAVLSRVWDATGWDPKEFANMLTWQRQLA